MSLLNRHKDTTPPSWSMPREDVDPLEGLVCVGETTHFPVDHRNRMTGAVTYEVFADRNNFAKVRFYRDPHGNLSAKDPGAPAPAPESLGTIRRRDPARSGSEPSDKIEDRIAVTPERLALLETLKPGSTVPLRKMLRIR